MEVQPGTLYVVATPIGNLEDCTTRALRLLREVSVIAAEDTRVTRKLLSHFDIHTPLVSYHEHSSARRLDSLVARLAAGENVALVSDAGTPGISDPGSELVRAALAAGIPVCPAPGPSAVLAALSAGGLDPSRFLFLGFLPRSAGERTQLLGSVARLPWTLVIYEAPNRVGATLTALAEALGDRRAVLARELTKRFEEFARDSLTALAAQYRDAAPRGECVLLVEGATHDPQSVSPADLDAALQRRFAAGESVRDAARAVAGELGLPRREIYARAQEIKERGAASVEEGEG